MNKLTAIITNIDTEDHISLVSAAIDNIQFSVLLIDTPDTAAYLQKGNKVSIVFKETAMSIGKNLSGGLSIRNRFPATITEIESSRLLTIVTLNFNRQIITSVITTGSANTMNLKKGDAVEGLVKTSDISIMQIQ